MVAFQFSCLSFAAICAVEVTSSVLHIIDIQASHSGSLLMQQFVDFEGYRDMLSTPGKRSPRMAPMPTAETGGLGEKHSLVRSSNLPTTQTESFGRHWSSGMRLRPMTGTKSALEEDVPEEHAVEEGAVPEPFAEIDLVDMLETSLSQALKDEDRLKAVNQQLQQEVEEWRAGTRNQIQAPVEPHISQLYVTGTNVHKATKAGNPGWLMWAWTWSRNAAFQVGSMFGSAGARASTQVQSVWEWILRELMFTQLANAVFLFALLSSVWYIGRMRILKFFTCGGKIRALEPVFRFVTRMPYNVEIAEVHIGGLPAGGARRLVVHVGSNEGRTSAVEDIEGAFVRFPETFNFAIQTSDERCVFSIIDDATNAETAHVELPAVEIINLAQRAQDYHRTNLTLGKDAAKAIRKTTRAAKPYIAMRVRDVTFNAPHDHVVV